jgi:hypothetical protein
VDIVIKALHDRMLGDFGHDLPDVEFETDAERIVEALTVAGMMRVTG